MGWTRRDTQAGFWSGIYPGLPVAADTRGLRRSGVSQRTEQPTGGNRRVGGRPARDRIPEVTGIHRNSRWDFPRKRALFTSDGPDSTTSGSDTPEGHADRPPDVDYSERLMTEKRQDEGGIESFLSYDIRNGGDPTAEIFGRLPHGV